MKLLHCLPALIIAVALFSCSKEKNDPQESLHDYSNEWDLTKCTGVLDDYYITLHTNDNNGGATYIETLQHYIYPQTPITWTRIEKDSVKMEFEFDAYPNYKWELRGLAVPGDSLVHGLYYRVNKNNPSDRDYEGMFTLKED